MTGSEPIGATKMLRAADGLATAQVGNVCVVVWRAAVTRERFETQRAALAEVARRRPQGFGLLCVIEPTSTPPDDELRRASMAMIREHDRVLRCIACVVEGSGFANAIARSALAAIALLIGMRTAPFSVFSSVPAAARWMEPRIELADPTLLARAVERVRRELDGAN